MNNNDMFKIVEVLTKEFEKNFDKYKQEGYTLANLTVIPCASRAVSSRKISDWGTDEDRDEYIWYAKDGWQHVDMTVQTGAGVKKVVKNNVNVISTQQVVDTIATWGEMEQMRFVEYANDILSSSDFIK